MADKNINTEYGFYFENSSINPSDLKFESKSYMEAFLKTSQDRKVLEGDFNGVVHLVTTALQQTLGVSRVSYWKYSPQKDSIYAEHFSPLSEEVPKSLPLNSFPVYGKAIKDKMIIAAHHARHFEKTEEFLNAYLIPEDIYSMLDAPVIFEGNLLGIIC